MHRTQIDEPHVGTLLKTRHDGPVRLVIQTHAYFCINTGEVTKRMLLFSNGETFWSSISEFYQIVQH